MRNNLLMGKSSRSMNKKQEHSYGRNTGSRKKMVLTIVYDKDTPVENVTSSPEFYADYMVVDHSKKDRALIIYKKKHTEKIIHQVSTKNEGTLNNFFVDTKRESTRVRYSETYKSSSLFLESVMV